LARVRSGCDPARLIVCLPHSTALHPGSLGCAAGNHVKLLTLFRANVN
jgi:hypothetical protein